MARSRGFNPDHSCLLSAETPLKFATVSPFYELFSDSVKTVKYSFCDNNNQLEFYC